MSKRISDAQIYGLLWMSGQSTGMISELHSAPLSVETSDGRRIELFRTAFDRAGLLGLERRGFVEQHRGGLWGITDAGRRELERPLIRLCIDRMAEATREDQEKLNGDILREVDESV